jgi:Mce-associated membrane protein
VRYAPWGARLGAMALDVLPGAAVIATMALMAWTTAPGSALRWTFVGAAAVVGVAMIANRIVLPAVKGWSLGRAVAGIRVVRADGTVPGMLRLALRDVAHLLDTVAAFVGWLWPLWDRRHRTFADMLSRTEVRAVDGPERNARRIAAWVLVAATVLCAAGAGLGYVTVYRYERAVDASRAQVSEQGPRIVEQVLSYKADTMVDDFARAQGLTTDGYRPQLIAQQQAVQKAGALGNEYWAVSSAVLSIEPKKASMLLAMQGQRGANANDLKFITATLRVDFEKVGDAWRVANLTVLKKPLLKGPTQ